jgi:hypothetical protein
MSCYGSTTSDRVSKVLPAADCIADRVRFTGPQPTKYPDSLRILRVVATVAGGPARVKNPVSPCQ